MDHYYVPVISLLGQLQKKSSFSIFWEKTPLCTYWVVSLLQEGLFGQSGRSVGRSLSLKIPLFSRGDRYPDGFSWKSVPRPTGPWGRHFQRGDPVGRVRSWHRGLAESSSVLWVVRLSTVPSGDLFIVGVISRNLWGTLSLDTLGPRVIKRRIRIHRVGISCLYYYYE